MVAKNLELKIINTIYYNLILPSLFLLFTLVPVFNDWKTLPRISLVCSMVVVRKKVQDTVKTYKRSCKFGNMQHAAVSQAEMIS